MLPFCRVFEQSLDELDKDGLLCIHLCITAPCVTRWADSIQVRLYLQKVCCCFISAQL